MGDGTRGISGGVKKRHSIVPVLFSFWNVEVTVIFGMNCFATSSSSEFTIFDHSHIRHFQYSTIFYIRHSPYSTFPTFDIHHIRPFPYSTFPIFDIFYIRHFPFRYSLIKNVVKICEWFWLLNTTNVPPPLLHSVFREFRSWCIRPAYCSTQVDYILIIIFTRSTPKNKRRLNFLLVQSWNAHMEMTFNAR